MASVATTNITNVTRTVQGLKGTSLNIGGCPVEVFRIAAGQALGDTAVLVPSTFSNVRAVFGPVAHNLPTSQTGASNVTVTLALASSAVTATISSLDVWLFGPLPQG
jgi:hypothetical protein